jgi:hypothetical protein
MREKIKNRIEKLIDTKSMLKAFYAEAINKNNSRDAEISYMHILTTQEELDFLNELLEDENL